MSAGYCQVGGACMIELMATRDSQIFSQDVFPHSNVILMCICILSEYRLLAELLSHNVRTSLCNSVHDSPPWCTQSGDRGDPRRSTRMSMHNGLVNSIWCWHLVAKVGLTKLPLKREFGKIRQLERGGGGFRPQCKMRSISDPLAMSSVLQVSHYAYATRQEWGCEAFKEFHHVHAT